MPCSVSGISSAATWPCHSCAALVAAATGTAGAASVACLAEKRTAAYSGTASHLQATGTAPGSDNRR
jgi:hypothetical protein